QTDLSGTYTLNEAGLVASEMPVASGDYQVSFEIQNFGGQVARASRPVVVNNDEMNPTLRGQNFATEFGFSGVLPVQWSNFVVENTFVWSSAVFLPVEPGNPYPGTTVFYNTIDTTNDSASTQQATFENSLGLFTGLDIEAIAEDEPVLIGGQEALAFQYETDDLIARGLTLHLPDSERTHLFVTYGDDVRVVEALYRVLREASAIYTAADLGVNSANWTESSVSVETKFPLPLVWGSAPTIEGDWFVYRPESDSTTMAAFQVMDTESVDLRDLLNESVADASNIREQTYISQTAAWDALEYSVTRDDTEIAGRLYLAEANGRRYVIQLETADEDAATTFTQTLEPIVSGFNIQNRFYIEDYADELGFVWYRPAPRLPGNPWNRRNYIPAIQQISADNFALTERVEVFLLPDLEDDDVSTLAGRLVEMFESVEIVGDIALVTVDSREVAEVDVTYNDGAGAGRYFATYDEGRQLGLIIGARATIGEGDFETHYDNIKRFITFTPADSYYPYRPVSELRVYDDSSGFDVDVPAVWQTVAIDRNFAPNVDRYWTATREGTVWMLWLDNATDDPQETFNRVFEGSFEVDTQGFRPVTIGGYEAVEFSGTHTGEDAPGLFFIVYDESRNRSYLIGHTTSGNDLDAIYEMQKSSFEVQALTGN
ncbi:MAG: hypothetical protein ACPG7F_16335, partial [Aggregatilineales bacterium]